MATPSSRRPGSTCRADSAGRRSSRRGSPLRSERYTRRSRESDIREQGIWGGDMTDMTGKAAGAAADGGSTAPEPTQAEIDAWAARERTAARSVAGRPDRRRASRVRAAPQAAPARVDLRRGRGADRRHRPDGRAPRTRDPARRRRRGRAPVSATRGGRSPSSSGPVASGRRRPPCRPAAAASRWMTRVPEGPSSAPGLRVALESRPRNRPATRRR